MLPSQHRAAIARAEKRRQREPDNQTATAEVDARRVDYKAAARRVFSLLRDRGVLRADVNVDEALRLWTVITSGVLSQQLSNAPGEPFETGTFTSTLPQLTAIFLSHFGPRPGPEPPLD